MQCTDQEPSAQWLTGKTEVVRYGGVSWRTISCWIGSKKLRVHKLNSRLNLIRRVDVDNFIRAESKRFQQRGAE